MATPLERLKNLTPEHLERLSQQWITTVEQLVGLSAHAQFRPFLAERLGMEYDALSAILRPFYDDGSLGLAAGLHDKRKFGMGLVLKPATVRSLESKDPYASPVPARAASRGGLTEKVSLIGKMPPVRDQGERGTCLAFSTCAVREYLAADQPDLSEQFFYWAMKQGSGHEGEGANIEDAQKALENSGTCLEATCPYDPNPCAPEEGPPPGRKAVQEARRYRWTGARRLLCRPRAIQQILSGREGKPGRAVVIGVMVFDSSFFSPDVFETGRITLPFRGEPCSGGHALCVVGYQDDPATPGGGYVIIRNSWGTRWATRGEYGPGYGMMPYAYLELYGVEALNLAGSGVGKEQDQEETLAPSHEGPQPAAEGVAAVSGVAAAAEASGTVAVAATPLQAVNVCAACGQSYASRFSLVRPCEICGALICQNCVKLKDRTRCRAHQER